MLKSNINVNILKAKLLEAELQEKGLPLPTLNPVQVPEMNS